MWGIVYFYRLNTLQGEMMKFLGTIEAKADAKGRLFIPAQFRKQLQAAAEEKLILRKDIFQDCLVLYPENSFNEELTELRRRLSKWDPKHQLIFRQFVFDLEMITPDNNGRILIPKRYLQMAGIISEVRFIGMDNNIEIWSKAKTDKPFMDTQTFGLEIEKIMGYEATKEETKHERR